MKITRKQLRQLIESSLDEAPIGDIESYDSSPFEGEAYTKALALQSLSELSAALQAYQDVATSHGYYGDDISEEFQSVLDEIDVTAGQLARTVRRAFVKLKKS